MSVIVPTHLPPYVGPPLVVLGTVLLVNGMNFLDGLDGLAAGVAATTSVGFAVLLVGSGRYLAVGLACALAGFLVFNRPPARIYLGDSGAYLLSRDRFCRRAQTAKWPISRTRGPVSPL